MGRIIVIIGLCLLAGCASQWNQEGKSRMETRQDSGACANQILTERKELNDDNMKVCMEAKGYQRRIHRRANQPSSSTDGSQGSADSAVPQQEAPASETIPTPESGPSAEPAPKADTAP
jgi:outer membrane murein-binding lipoprotein Lpp